MGLAYYRIQPSVLESLQAMIDRHEADSLGPRARGYWFDYPEEYDYEDVRRVAHALDEAGRANLMDYLELSEVQAHALSQLEIELPHDGKLFAPALFMSSVTPIEARTHLSAARRHLGSNVERAASHFAIKSRDPRVTGYLKKQLRHLREALPMVWRFYERAAEAEGAILVVDLRARDVYIPDAIELMGTAASW